MSERGYTISDTPARVERVESDLQRVKTTVVEADPRLRSLVLTGGFARGEGSMVDDVPQNDYDLVAVRSIGRPRVPYPRIRSLLEAELGIHLDLAPVGGWRLPLARGSIFWYETALRGRVLWGEDLLSKIPVRDPARLDPEEAVRLLCNRAAGLLLVTKDNDPHAYRIQGSKGLLAAMDVSLMANGLFAPSQVERRRIYLERMRDGDAAPMGALEPWLDWAFSFKVSPECSEHKDPKEAWRASARAVLSAVPVALAHAGIPTWDELARRDDWTDSIVYSARSAKVPGARRLCRHPSGRVRLATLRLLEASLDGKVPVPEARALLAPLARADEDPLGTLEGLRKATLQ